MQTSKGFYDKILAVDVETSGLCYSVDDPSFDSVQKKPYQIVSIGLIVASSKDFKPIEKLYLEIQWDGYSLWNDGAERVHKLSKAYLKENGVTSEEAVEAIGALILKHWGPDNTVRLLGHNVGGFDVWFIRRLFREFDINLKFGTRFLDSNSVGLAVFSTYTSDELFELLGCDRKEKHNALDDAMFALKTFQYARAIAAQELK